MSKARILAALYNHAKPLGHGWMHYNPTPMTEREAEDLLRWEKTPYFDYHRGRLMKILITDHPEDLDGRLYERDNGVGSVMEALTCPGCNRCQTEDSK